MELLVFDHADDDPEQPSGTQIPAGGMLPFEGIEDAAAREVAEEVGLTGLTFVAQLGGVEVALGDPGRTLGDDVRPPVGSRRRTGLMGAPSDGRRRRRGDDVRLPVGAAAA